jgi:hypothetical protein
MKEILSKIYNNQGLMYLENTETCLQILVEALDASRSTTNVNKYNEMAELFNLLLEERSYALKHNMSVYPCPKHLKKDYK